MQIFKMCSTFAILIKILMEKLMNHLHSVVPGDRKDPTILWWDEEGENGSRVAF